MDRQPLEARDGWLSSCWCGYYPSDFPDRLSTQPSPAYSGTFIPEIWSGKLIEKFYASTVLAAISNTDYEGEIKNQGDTVHIRTKPTITIRDYLAGGQLAVDRPASNIVDLKIDKGKYFNEILDDVMEIQSDINLMGIWSDDAAQQMKIMIDAACSSACWARPHAAEPRHHRGQDLGQHQSRRHWYAGADRRQPGHAAGGGSGHDPAAHAANGPGARRAEHPRAGPLDRHAAWAAAMIKGSELRQAYLSGDQTSILRNGRLGMIDRFTIYVSNLLPKGRVHRRRRVRHGVLAAGEWVIYAGHAHGLTFASQISKVETLRSEFTFGTLLRGLQVYGYKVIDDIALAEAIVSEPVPV